MRIGPPQCESANDHLADRQAEMLCDQITVIRQRPDPATAIAEIRGRELQGHQRHAQNHQHAADDLHRLTQAASELVPRQLAMCPGLGGDGVGRRRRHAHAQDDRDAHGEEQRQQKQQ